jgi:hypothetical protein
MPKRSSKPKRSKDVNQNAFAVVKQITTAEPLVLPERSMLSQIMAEMGRKGGKKGGKRRMVTMTQEQRSQIALKAAKARWNKVRKSS